jgi:hypothetical protein
MERVWRSSSSSNVAWKFAPVKQTLQEIESQGELTVLVEAIYSLRFLAVISLRNSSENGCFHPGWCTPYMTVSWAWPVQLRQFLLEEVIEQFMPMLAEKNK